MTHRALIVAAVILCHGVGLWALHSGLQRHTAEVLVPVVVMADVIETAQAQAVVPPPERVSPPSPPNAPRSVPPTPAVAQPSPMPVSRPEPAPVAAALPAETVDPKRDSVPPPWVPAATPSGSAEPTFSTAEPPTPTPPPTPQMPQTPPKVELPSSKAAYLNNPPPAYPRMSQRLGEQGLVVVHTLINTDGSAQRAVVKTSSGYERLDKLAVETALKWRYVPGKRNGEPEAMWFDVPIHFQIK